MGLEFDGYDEAVTDYLDRVYEERFTRESEPASLWRGREYPGNVQRTGGTDFFEDRAGGGALSPIQRFGGWGFRWQGPLAPPPRPHPPPPVQTAATRTAGFGRSGGTETSETTTAIDASHGTSQS